MYVIFARGRRGAILVEVQQTYARLEIQKWTMIPRYSYYYWDKIYKMFGLKTYIVLQDVYSLMLLYLRCCNEAFRFAMYTRIAP